MAEPVNNSGIVNFNFPLNDQGIKDSFKSIKETLDKLPLSEKVNICVTFESLKHPELHAIYFERHNICKMDLTGLKDHRIYTIMSLFQEHNISIKLVTLNSGPTFKTPIGGNILCRSGPLFITTDVKAIRTLYRAKCEGKSNDEVIEMFSSI